MLSAVKISELQIHPQATDPNFIDQDHILPVLGYDSGTGVWTTYKAPISSVVPAINISAEVSSLASTDTPTVTVSAGAIRNTFALDFHIPQGRVPALSGRNLYTLPTSAVPGDAKVVFESPVSFDPNVDFFVDFYVPKGPKGDQGDQGIGINFKGFKNTKLDLTNTVSPCLGDAWFVKADESIMSPASSDVFYIYSLSGNPANTTWVAGGSGLKGPKGERGDVGDYVTFVSTSAFNLAPGSIPTAVVAPQPGTSFPLTEKRLVLGIPQGLSGVSPVLSADPVALSAVFGTAPNVQTLGTANRPVFKFTIPQGPTGLQGLSGITPTLAVGSVSALSAGSMPIIRPAAGSGLGNLTIDFGIPMGRTPVVMVGSVSALSAGATPIVQTTTSSDNLSSTLSFGIPVGRAATVTLATPPAVSATFTAQPSVFNTGSLSAAVLQFAIPRGAPGDWTTPQTIVPVTGGTTYAATASDVGKILTMSHAGGTVVQIPTGLTVGTKIDIIRMSAGAVSVAPGAGTPSVVGTPSLILRAQYSAVSVICVAANSYVVVGDLA